MNKYKIIISSAIGIASLVLAFSASAQTSATEGHLISGVASGAIRARMEGRLGSSTVPMNMGARMGSTTPGMRGTAGGGMSSTTRMEAQQQRQEQRITAVEDRSNTEIANRIDSLNALLNRVNGMTNISASDKASLVSSVQAEIASLNSLKSSIDIDTSTSSLKADAQSITKSYRVYALVLPQASITAAADRVADLVTDFNSLVTKLQGYITTAQTSGTDVTSANSAMADLTAKVSDASKQSATVVAEVSVLVPDQGATTTLQANTAALKDAESKIKTATSDLAAARKDVTTIVAVIKNSMKAPGGSASAGASVSASTTATTMH